MKVAYVGIDILYPALTSLYDTGVEIIKIFTCKTDNVTEFNTDVISFAKERDIPIQMERIRKEDLYELLEMGCDFVLVGGYYHIIPVIDELRIVNIHPAYLPVGRGAWPMPVTILKGLKESGVTLHRMVPELDAGDIILQTKVDVYPDDDLQSLSMRQNSTIPSMVQKLVSDFDRLWNSATPQSEGAQYWELPAKEECTVRDTDSFEKADLILRAFYGYECYYINTVENKEYEIISARAHKGAAPMPLEGETFFSIEGGYISSQRVRCL